jgi:hypothetical protein
MTYIDVFNGDADGICSLIQLRLAEPRQSQLVTGIKRDINLLNRVEAVAGDWVTVLDISMQKNHTDLDRLLSAGAEVFYADHHNPGDIIKHDKLAAYIDMSPSVCTALIVDKFLGGQFRLWAVTAAFGDNLEAVAVRLAREYGLSEAESGRLSALGTYLNYNGYGASLDDLFYHPADLFKECVAFASPFEFIEQKAGIFETLQNGYLADIEAAEAEKPFHETSAGAAIMLPDEKWARRVSGVFSNQLSNQYPDRAHVILTKKKEGDYLVSIRAPQSQLAGADEVAGQFSSGGGRKGAAGINALKETEIPLLIDLMEQRYG